MASTNQPLIVIVGPTASGKTALAIKLALEYNGEIVCADSRTIYKGMDIGTAKPSKEEQSLVKHHLLDIVEPNQSFSAAEFKKLALTAIADIRKRGKVPFLVGGSGLYIDSVIFDYQFGPPADELIRKQLTNLSLEELIEYCRKNDIELPNNVQNKRYLIRAIEQNGVTHPKRSEIIENCFVVGIATDRLILKQRISQRADQLFASGALDEAINLGKRYGWRHEAMTGNIYRIAKLISQDGLDARAAKARFITLDWHLAKRQMTWFKRNPFIQWGSAKEIGQLIRGILHRAKHATIEHDSYTSRGL